MIRRSIGLAMTLILLVVVVGCSVDTELGGTKIPNSRPDTRLTGQPPTLLEAGFAVNFHWTGSDPDGRIVGYQWKISDNGIDGISPRDTLTFDPLTGAEIHPWRFTAANDTTFLVLADQPNFPGDEIKPRSFRSHSLFMRAMDENGAVDPSPAIVSFTSTTIVPTARVEYPNLPNRDPKLVPPTVNMGWSGVDSDYELKTPVKGRFLWKSGLTPSGNLIQNLYGFNLYSHEILNFDDPDWSEWMPYATLDENRQVVFPKNPTNEYFLFAVQVQDTAGAVSVGLGYQKEVAHVKIIEGFFRPSVTLFETFLGQAPSSEWQSEIAGGQPLNFIWNANSLSYNGTIVSYRHGWDVADVNNADDLGWAVPPGLSEQNLFAEERSFAEGSHTFTLRVEDDSEQVALYTWTLRVIPFVSREFQKDLIVLDQVVDKNASNWPDQGGTGLNDQQYRNAYWRFLADGVGGVAGMTWENDWWDHLGNVVTFADVVDYKVVLCYAQTNKGQLLFEGFFRPRRDIDKFVWMTPYQERGGNLFLVGGSSMESFLEVKSNYAVPMIFDTREEEITVDSITFITGFGEKELPDGTDVQRGPLLYPYATAGIAALDWTSPNTKTIYNRSVWAHFDRSVDCVGLKSLVLQDDFKDQHLIGPGVVADTLLTEKTIDWQDTVDAAVDTMRLFHLTFPFRNDEFVDGNISSRSTLIAPQDCDEGPGGKCVEPMFRGIARFDFIRNYYRDRGENWPSSRYDSEALTGGCGEYALTSFEGEQNASALTNGQIFGYYSYKKIADKPRKRADVYWGFDPYRFDHEESKRAIRWVLQDLGLTINQ